MVEIKSTHFSYVKIIAGTYFLMNKSLAFNRGLLWVISLIYHEFLVYISVFLPLKKSEIYEYEVHWAPNVV